jgi:hypothetical protein
MGRRKMDPTKKRSLVINVRFPSGQKAVLHEAMRLAGVETLSEYVRFCVTRDMRARVNLPAAGPPPPSAD